MDYKLPDSTLTDDYDFYIAEWEQLIKPMLERLNLKLIGFDPGYLVQMTEKPYRTLDIPIWFAMRFYKSLTTCQNCGHIDDGLFV